MMQNFSEAVCASFCRQGNLSLLASETSWYIKRPDDGQSPVERVMSVYSTCAIIYIIPSKTNKKEINIYDKIEKDLMCCSHKIMTSAFCKQVTSRIFINIPSRT